MARRLDESSGDAWSALEYRDYDDFDLDRDLDRDRDRDRDHWDRVEGGQGPLSILLANSHDQSRKEEDENDIKDMLLEQEDDHKLAVRTALERLSAVIPSASKVCHIPFFMSSLSFSFFFFHVHNMAGFKFISLSRGPHHRLQLYL